MPLQNHDCRRFNQPSWNLDTILGVTPKPFATRKWTMKALARTPNDQPMLVRKTLIQSQGWPILGKILNPTEEENLMLG